MKRATCASIFCFFLSCLFACGHVKRKVSELKTRTINKVTDVGASILISTLSMQNVDTVSLLDYKKAFGVDRAVKEIKGIRTSNFFLYTYYFKYTAKKSTVLKGVGEIKPAQRIDFPSDEMPKSCDWEAFYQDVVAAEKTAELAFFWTFEQQKDAEIYTCSKRPFVHYIIFDKNSDTVYHRIEECRE